MSRVFYITGNTNREMTIGGLLVPKRNYSQVELNAGKKSILQVDEARYTELMGNAVFKDMVTTQQVTIHDEEPISLLSFQERYSAERRKTLDFQKQLEAADNRAKEFERLYNELKAKADGGNGELAAQNASLRAELDALKQDAADALAKKEGEINDLKAALKKIKKGSVDE